jgi:hypothetical protein
MVSLLDLAKRYEDMAADREATARRLMAVHERSAQSFWEEAELLREMAAGLQKRFQEQNNSAVSDR